MKGSQISRSLGVGRKIFFMTETIVYIARKQKINK